MRSNDKNETNGQELPSFTPPLFRSTRGLIAYYALVLPVAGAAVYCMIQGGELLQTAVYLVVGLVAALSLSYTAWLAYTFFGDAVADALCTFLPDHWSPCDDSPSQRHQSAPKSSQRVST